MKAYREYGHVSYRNFPEIEETAEHSCLNRTWLVTGDPRSKITHARVQKQHLETAIYDKRQVRTGAASVQEHYAVTICRGKARKIADDHPTCGGWDWN